MSNRRKRGTKDVDKLDLPEGYSLREAKGATHLVVIRPDGEPLRKENGMPLHVALSPGITRTRRHERAQIRRALKMQEADLGSAPRPDSERRP